MLGETGTFPLDEVDGVAEPSLEVFVFPWKLPLWVVELLVPLCDPCSVLLVELVPCSLPMSEWVPFWFPHTKKIPATGAPRACLSAKVVRSNPYLSLSWKFDNSKPTGCLNRTRVYFSSPELIGPRYFTAGVSGDEKATGNMIELMEETTESEEETSPGCTK